MSYPTTIDSFATNVDGVDYVLAADMNAVQTAAVAIETALGVAAWVDWTPTIAQSGAVTVTITTAKYKIINGIVHIEVSLTVTGAGTGNNAIVIGGQPAAIQGTTNSVIGIGVIVDFGTQLYIGAIIIAGATNWQIFRDGGGGSAIGINPNFALAVDDSIRLQASYKVA